MQTKDRDILRASSIKRFRKKLSRNVRRDSTGSDHEVGMLKQGSLFPWFHFKGGKAFSYWIVR